MTLKWFNETAVTHVGLDRRVCHRTPHLSLVATMIDTPPERCAWCEKPIVLGESFARVEIIKYDGDHDSINSCWSDYHHDPSWYEQARHTPLVVLLREAPPRKLCLWHSEHNGDPA